MIRSAKNYTKKPHKKRTDRTLGQMVKTKVYRQITQRSIHIHTHKKRKRKKKNTLLGFPGGAVVENLPANAGDTGSSPGLGRSHMPRSN